MTPEQARAIEEAASAGLVVALQEAYADIVEAIRAGTAPRDAVQAAMASFTGEMAGTMAAALSAILQTSVGSAEVMAMQVGHVSLSRRLYAEAGVASTAVEGAVTRHVAGFQDSRRLARDLYEGYNFRPPDAEPIKFNRSNPILPKYMREALLTDDKVAAGIARAFAQIQVNGLRTASLRAAYEGVLRALDEVQAGVGDVLLSKRINVAFFERMRYFAERISRTELHRAYANREAELAMADKDVQFVEVRRAPGRFTPCICSMMAGRDLYGLGRGVYPKAQAPIPPFHPFCQCVQVRRLDLTGRTAKPLDEGGDAYFLNRLGEGVAARVMGSAAKRDEVLSGRSALDVVNKGRDPLYHVRSVRG